jgi:hypothetical protein
MSFETAASPGTPGDGYQDTNDRDIHAKQSEDVGDSAAFRDDNIGRSDVNVLPGTGGPDDVGDEEVPDDYDPTGHARESGDSSDDSSDDPTVESDGSPVENPSG